MNFYKFLLVSIGFFLIPSFVFGQGFVPCGTQTNASGTIVNPCTYCDLLKMGDSILRFLVKMIFPIAAVMFTVGGFFMMTAGGSPEKYKKGMGVMKSAVIGILIAMLAWIIIDTILKIIAPDYARKFGVWNELKCK